MNWVNVLDKVISAINHSKNRALGGLRPMDISFSNANKIWEQNYGKFMKKNATMNQKGKKAKFKIGDHIRMSRDKGIFEKGYLPNYGDEILEIDAVKKQSGNTPVRYKVKDERGEKFHGKFYEHELIPVRKDAETTYRIEKVYRKRTNQDGTKQLLVKFIGYPDREWIDETQLV